ncbi:DDE-type integrase/transposase/recombinase [Teredinibacter purpureus]|uniref:DDE-type integrase/transposase/recombinase n=1 Tax=Teredinibacter purpureus TaxID=2731756 RepID=UPI0005F89839|nr:DDE-type integrase/transposase/recombinase [Teredinibacter purpureus]
MTSFKKPPLELRLRILSAIDYAPGNSIRARIQSVAERTFVDEQTDSRYQFTWRTISTWLYRFKKYGVTTLDNKTRRDKNSYRKVQVNELAEAINEVIPSLSKNKVGVIPKMTLYRQLMQKNYFARSQLSQTSFYRMVRENDLLNFETTKKLRHSFAMQFANELWQADTMYGPSIKQVDGSWKKTFLIAFIDDASRVITHGQFFYNDNTENMVDAFRTALFKRGKPDRLYFDNGSNYKSKEILQACVRLDILLSHAPVRDGAAKGKIERFFRGFRDRFLVQHLEFKSIEALNDLTHDWIENEYNHQKHSSIQMTPIDRFALDHSRIHFLVDDEYTEEVFFVEEVRKVSKTNLFSINSSKWECPVDLREKKIQVRFDRNNKQRFIVYFNDQRMGEASPINLVYNANLRKSRQGEAE